MKLFKFLFLASIALSISSCGEEAAEQVVSETVNPNDSLFAVSEGPFQFRIALPRDLMIANSPNVHFNDATGELEVEIGETFHLILTQEHGDFSKMLAELEEDGQLFDNKILEQSSEAIVYQQVLPTGDSYFFHFYSNAAASDKWYLAKSWSLGEFTLENITRMRQAVRTIRPLA